MKRKQLAAFILSALLSPLLLTTCEVWGKADNPVDPAASVYQGYPTVNTSGAIATVSPANGGAMAQAKLVLSAVLGATAYRIALSPTLQGLDSATEIEVNNNAVDLGTAAILNGSTYFWKARSKGLDGVWGDWSPIYSFTTHWANASANPVMNPPPGTYSTAQNIALSCATPGAKIYYTLDGSEPSPGSISYPESGIDITGDGTGKTIKAIAIATGYSVSQPATGEYEIDGSVWTGHNAAGTRSWSGVSMSYDGTHIVAINGNQGIWNSSDSGGNWAKTRSLTSAFPEASIVSDSLGAKIAAIPHDYWYMQITASGGSSWSEVYVKSGICSLAGSADGSHLIAASFDTVQVSTDYGAHWTECPPIVGPYHYWVSAASDSTGNRLVVSGYAGSIWVTTDAGATWTATSAGTNSWQALASSSDGSRLAAAAYGDKIATSSDYGATWTSRTAAGQRHWSSIASSSDGSRLIATDQGGYIWTSSDYGETWLARKGAGARQWHSVCCSQDGLFIAAADYGGLIWTGVLPP